MMTEVKNTEFIHPCQVAVIVKALMSIDNRAAGKRGHRCSRLRSIDAGLRPTLRSPRPQHQHPGRPEWTGETFDVFHDHRADVARQGLQEAEIEGQGQRLLRERMTPSPAASPSARGPLANAPVLAAPGRGGFAAVLRRRGWPEQSERANPRPVGATHPWTEVRQLQDRDRCGEIGRQDDAPSATFSSAAVSCKSQARVHARPSSAQRRCSDVCHERHLRVAGHQAGTHDAFAAELPQRGASGMANVPENEQRTGFAQMSIGRAFRCLHA